MREGRRWAPFLFCRTSSPVSSSANGGGGDDATGDNGASDDPANADSGRCGAARNGSRRRGSGDRDSSSPRYRPARSSCDSRRSAGGDGGSTAGRRSTDDDDSRRHGTPAAGRIRHGMRGRHRGRQDAGHRRRRHVLPHETRGCRRHGTPGHRLRREIHHCRDARHHRRHGRRGLGPERSIRPKASAWRSRHRDSPATSQAQAVRTRPPRQTVWPPQD